MGYANYTLPDGREAGYGVEAKCDKPDCDTKINRGMDYLCGEAPDGHRAADEAGCGKYHCPTHQLDHACENDVCGDGGPVGDFHCIRMNGHEGAHRDADEGDFTDSED